MQLNGGKPEFGVSALFGILAFLFSFITSLFAGNRFSYVAVTSCVLAAIFAGAGFGVIRVFKRFVPEVYEALAGLSSVSFARKGPPEEMVSVPLGAQEQGGASRETASVTADEQGGGESGREGMASPPGEEDKKADTSAAFVPLGEDDYSRVSAQAQEGKMGKHIIQQKKIRYEPKIMAEAIRTMISRDKD